MFVLYHGSPHLVNELHEKKPRGDTSFNSKQGIYCTSNFIEASIYAIARDIERNNKSWGVAYIKNSPFLILKKEKWHGSQAKYALNKIGYVYEFNFASKTRIYQNPNPDRVTEWRINKKNIIPTKIHVVLLKHVKKYILYLSEAEYNLFWSQRNT